jgi:hypothetical protein
MKMTSVRFLAFTIIALLFTQHSVLALDNPVYQNGILTIPYVDTSEQLGKYLDITMTQTKGGAWKLNSYKESTSKLIVVTQATVITNEVLPKQVFLRLSGYTCGSINHTIYRIDKNGFNIVLHDDYGLDSRLNPCVASIKTKTIALPVYGLKTDTYTFDVNGKKGGFYLATDNRLPGLNEDRDY